MANAPKKSAVPPAISAAAPVEAAVATVNAVLTSEAATRRRAGRRDSTELPQRARKGRGRVARGIRQSQDRGG